MNYLKKYKVVIAVGLLVLSIFVFFVNYKKNETNSFVSESCFNKVITHLEKFPTLAVFEDYPVAKIYSGFPAKLDLNSGSYTKQFYTRIVSRLSNGVNFAGHYTIEDIGMTGQGYFMGVIDVETGKVYDFPFENAELSYSYKNNSKLIIVDSKEAIIEYTASDGLSKKSSYCTDTGSHSFVNEILPRYYLWENNKFVSLNLDKK